MRNTTLAFKGLRYHFRKCIYGGFCAVIRGALKPIRYWKNTSQ
jgi:hypothetical protein